MQIKTTEIAKYRNMFAAKQKYKCAICGDSIAKGIVTLDHDHETGKLRGTLCNTCNRSEGKVKKAAQYMAKVTHMTKVNYIGWLKKLIEYLEYSKENPSELIHPSFDIKLGRQAPIKRRRK